MSHQAPGPSTERIGPIAVTWPACPTPHDHRRDGAVPPTPSSHFHFPMRAGSPPAAPVTYHYGIVHVLAFMDVPLTSAPRLPLPLPRVTAGDDAREATWFAFTDGQMLDAETVAGDEARPRRSVVALQREGTLVPQIDRVAARCREHIRARAAVTGARLMSDVVADRKMTWSDVAWATIDVPFGAALGVGFSVGVAMGAWGMGA